MTTAPPLSLLVMMISYLLNSLLAVSLSSLWTFGCGYLGLKILVHTISLLATSTKASIYNDFCLVPTLCFCLF